MISYSRFMYVPCIYTNLPFNHPKMSSIWVFERSLKTLTHTCQRHASFPRRSIKGRLASPALGRRTLMVHAHLPVDSEDKGPWKHEEMIVFHGFSFRIYPPKICQKLGVCTNVFTMRALYFYKRDLSSTRKETQHCVHFVCKKNPGLENKRRYREKAWARV